MTPKTLLFGVLFASTFHFACGPGDPGRAAQPGGGKADGPNDFVVVVDTEVALAPLVRVTNQTTEDAWAELCRDAWWERKILERESEHGEDEAVTERARWEPAGPAELSCGGGTSWEFLPAGERKALGLSLPTADWTPDAEDEAPAPGTYRLAVAVIDGLGADARSLGIFRSAEIVLADVTGECQALCGKVESCQTAAGGTYAATECDTWCKTLLSPARGTTAADCSSCFTEQACGDVLPEAKHPYQIAAGNPGACAIECGLGSCETDADCGAGQSCRYDTEVLAGYYGGGPGYVVDDATWAERFSCQDSVPHP